MGLDLICSSMDVRVGSYSMVHKVRNYLIESLINYLTKGITDKPNNNSVYERINKQAKIELLDLLNQVIINNEISYQKLIEIKPELSICNLNGFTCFINHSDCDGGINSIEAEQFIATLDTVKDFMNKDIFHEDGEFYLKKIFEESINTGEVIIFC